jgi:hypothetical protein
MIPKTARFKGRFQAFLACYKLNKNNKRKKGRMFVWLSKKRKN